jgi:hypothetical protein
MEIINRKQRHYHEREMIRNRNKKEGNTIKKQEGGKHDKEITKRETR